MTTYTLDQIYAFLNSVSSLDEAKEKVLVAYSNAKRSEISLRSIEGTQEPMTPAQIELALQQDLGFLEKCKFYGFDEQEALKNWYADIANSN